MKQQCINLILIISVFFALGPTAHARTPSRVISLGPIITEMIYLLSADDLLIANTSYCNVPEAAKHKPKIGSLIQMNVEKILTLEPDVVLASPLASQQQLQVLKNMGISVVQFQNPETFAKMCAMMAQLGELLGKADRARQIIDAAEKEVDTVITATSALPRKTVFIQIGLRPLHTSPKGTFIHEYIEFAGGINVAADATSGNYSREVVLEKNPDIIFIATMGSSKSGAKKEKKTWESYPSLTATKNQTIYILDPEAICSPTPVSFAETLKDIVPLIHPEISFTEKKAP